MKKNVHPNFCTNFVDYSTECKVIIKVIDINNEIPVFEKNDVYIHFVLLLKYFNYILSSYGLLTNKSLL